MKYKIIISILYILYTNSNSYSQQIATNILLDNKTVDISINGLHFINSTQFIFCTNKGVYCYDISLKKTAQLKIFNEDEVVYKTIFNIQKNLLALSYYNSKLEVYHLIIAELSLDLVCNYSDSIFLNSINAMTFNNSGNKIAIGSSTGIVKIFDLNNLTILENSQIKLSQNLIWSIYFDAEDKNIFVGSNNGMIYKVNIYSKKSKSLKQSYLEEEIIKIGSMGENYYACDYRGVILFNKNDKVVNGLCSTKFSIQSTDFSSESGKLAIGCIKNGEVLLISKNLYLDKESIFTDIKTINDSTNNNSLESINLLSFSTDGKYIAFANNHKEIFYTTLR